MRGRSNQERCVWQRAWIRARRFSPRTWLSVLALAFLPLLIDSCFRWQSSGSVPRGLYLLTHERPHRGSWVVACLPPKLARHGRERGYLGGGRCDGSAEILKQVVALPGDTVRVEPSGLTVNGSPLTPTARRRVDSAGRPIEAIPAGLYTVAPDEVWLASTHHPRSWDSRYYGAVPLAGVRSTACLLNSTQLFVP